MNSLILEPNLELSLSVLVFIQFRVEQGKKGGKREQKCFHHRSCVSVQRVYATRQGNAGS